MSPYFRLQDGLGEAGWGWEDGSQESFLIPLCLLGMDTHLTYLSLDMAMSHCLL